MRKGSADGTLLFMKQVSIQELKRHLSALLAEAAAGETVVVTRHRRPVAQLTSADLDHLRPGARHGRGKLVPLLKGATGERYLDVLADDRRGARE
jgi:prevent-host-death family protein